MLSQEDLHPVLTEAGADFRGLKEARGQSPDPARHHMRAQVTSGKKAAA